MDRPWDPPGAYWPDQPDILAGRDRLAGGSWMGLNGAGVVAAVLNRPGSLGPAQGKLSRGDLPLLALTHDTAAAASRAIMALDGRDYRSFNLVMADRHGVYFIRNDDSGTMSALVLPPGLHMVTARDPDDPASARVARHLPRFRAATAPEPPDWGDWARLLADEAGPRDAALNVPPQDGFGTVCASLLAIPEAGSATWLFAPGRPGDAAFAQAAGGEGALRLL